MAFSRAWKKFGSRFLAKTFLNIYLQSVLAVSFPVVAVGALLVYCILAHGLNIYYTASFWSLMALIWTLPGCCYFLKLYIEKRRAKSYDMEEEDLEDEEVEGILSHEKSINASPRLVRVNRSFSLDFIADGFMDHKFVPTVWNGLGITACVFGILASLMGSGCNFLAGDVASGITASVTLLAAIASMYLVICGSLGVQQPPANPFAPRNKRRERLVLCGKILFAIVGVAVVSINILGALQSFVTVFNAHHYHPPGKLYDVGDSRKMHLHCNGTGGPTVMYLHGWSGQAYDWAWVQPRVAQLTKSCSLDRTGYGWSDSPSCLRCPRTAEVQARDLDALLKAAKIEESLILVVHAEAVLDARVFVNTYQDHHICGIICVDCVDTATLPSGSHKNPAPTFWDLWRNLLPSGLGGLLAASDQLTVFKLYDPLPESIHPNYIQNDLKPKFPETVVMEYEDLPRSVQQAEDAGDFGNLPFVGLVAGLGLNATGVRTLSTNSSLVFVPNSPHDMPFHNIFSSVISEQIARMLRISRLGGCANVKRV